MNANISHGMKVRCVYTMYNTVPTYCFLHAATLSYKWAHHVTVVFNAALGCMQQKHHCVCMGYDSAEYAHYHPDIC